MPAEDERMMFPQMDSVNIILINAPGIIQSHYALFSDIVGGSLGSAWILNSAVNPTSYKITTGKYSPISIGSMLEEFSAQVY